MAMSQGCEHLVFHLKAFDLVTSWSTIRAFTHLWSPWQSDVARMDNTFFLQWLQGLWLVPAEGVGVILHCCTLITSERQ